MYSATFSKRYSGSIRKSWGDSVGRGRLLSATAVTDHSRYLALWEGMVRIDLTHKPRHDIANKGQVQARKAWVEQLGVVSVDRGV